MLDGVTGYLEAEYQGATATARGFAEVESDALRILLPSVFTREWDYNYVNGRIDFLARLQEGFSLKLKSNAVSAVSENTDATVQFFTQLKRPLEGEPESVLELLIGVNSMDAADRYLYLPDGPRISPSLQATMEWSGLEARCVKERSPIAAPYSGARQCGARDPKKRLSKVSTASARDACAMRRGGRRWTMRRPL